MLQLFFFLMILTAKCVAFVKHKRERYQSEHHSVVQCCTAARGHKSCHFLSVHFLSLCRAFLTQFVVYFRCSTSQQQLQKFTFTLKWQDRAYFKDFRDFFFFLLWEASHYNERLCCRFKVKGHWMWHSGFQTAASSGL